MDAEFAGAVPVVVHDDDAVVEVAAVDGVDDAQVHVDADEEVDAGEDNAQVLGHNEDVALVHV